MTKRAPTKAPDKKAPAPVRKYILVKSTGAVKGYQTYAPGKKTLLQLCAAAGINMALLKKINPGVVKKFGKSKILPPGTGFWVPRHGSAVVGYVHPQPSPPQSYVASASLTVQATNPAGITLDPISWVSALGGPSLSGRTTDDQQNVWEVPTGAFQQGGYEGGSAWPVTPGTRSVALVPGAANGQVGVTFRSPPLTGAHTQALVFRYSDDSNYWSATRTQLKKKVAGAWTVIATYATAFADNDRLVVSMNGSVINVFRNAGAVDVATVTDAFNDTATLHGIEAT
jgi:hypothetical protein